METRARILYVEDDKTLLYVTKDNLELKGYSVDFCEDGSLRLTGSVPGRMTCAFLTSCCQGWMGSPWPEK